MNERNKNTAGDGDALPGIAASGTSPLMEAIKRYIKQQYEPTVDYVTAVKLSTNEFHERITRLFPSGDISPDELVEWLYEQGYRFYDEGGMKFVWLFKEV